MNNELIQITGPDGLMLWRDPKARNKYNPEGITLASIRKSLAPYYYDQLQKVREHEEGVTNIRLGSVDGDAPYDSQAYMIRDEDKEVAEFIAKFPIATIAASELRSTIARWTYSAHCSRIHEIKNHGGEMLKMAFPTVGHRPRAIPYTDASMFAAYQDGMLLAECLNNCMRDSGKSYEQIAEHFPFLDELKDVGQDFAYRIKLEKPAYTPSAFAIDILQHWSGLKRTAISDAFKRVSPAS